MKRVNFLIDNSTFIQLKELPGTMTEHIRIAIRQYLERIKEFNASASESKRKEEQING